MEPMREDETRNLLRNCRYGHLGLADGGRAYVVPLVFGFDGKDIYFHLGDGTKVEYMDATEEACFQVDVVGNVDDWASAIVFGTLERLESDEDRLVAMDALLAETLPPEWGISAAGEPARNEPELLYRLKVERLTGRKSVREVPEERAEVPEYM